MICTEKQQDIKERQEKVIYLLLSRFYNPGAKIIEIMTGCYYSHTSIGLSEDMNTFYTFVVKGFLIEDLNRYANKENFILPCQLYEIVVTEEEYDRIKRILRFYVKNRHKFAYTQFGLAMALMRIPFKRKYKYFCSEFVAEVLKRSKVMKFKRPTSICMSKHLLKDKQAKKIYEGNVRSLVQELNIKAQAS